MPLNQLKIGCRIQALRKNANLTQEALAEICDVSWRTISNLERGLVMPTLQLVYALSQHFNISIDELLNNNPKSTKTLTRLRLENQITEAIQALDDKLLLHISAYIALLKKDFTDYQ